MNVLIVSSWLPYPPDNGSRMRAYHLIRVLARRHRITLLAFGQLDTSEAVAPLSAICETMRVIPPTVIDRTRLGFRGLLSSVPRHLVQNASLAMGREVARHVGACDVAVGMQLDAARYLEPWTGVPRVFEEAEIAILRDRFLQETRHAPRARRRLTWVKSARFVRRLVAGFDRTTVVSELELDHLRAAGCDTKRVAVIPNGTAVAEVIRTGARQDRLIYPGALTYSANLDAMKHFVADVFPLVRRARPRMELWITGATDGVDVSGLMVPGVRLTGHLPDVEPTIAESAVCIVPLRIGGGTRLKALQAMALGTPVVSTSKGVEGLRVEPEHHVLVADTPQAFAAQVLRMCSDNALRQRITSAAGRFVREHHEWSAIGAALNEVLEAAVEAHRQRARRTTTVA